MAQHNRSAHHYLFSAIRDMKKASSRPLKHKTCKLSYLIFVAISAWKVFFKDATRGSPSYDMLHHQYVNTTSITKVLITRTVSPSEIPNVVKDIAYIKSFYTLHGEILKQNSRVYCDVLKNGYAINWTTHADFNPYINGTQSFPNHVLCNSNYATMDNYYSTIRVDFMLFVRSEEDAQEISQKISHQSESMQTKQSLHEVKIDIRDVSNNPKKLYNWIMQLTGETLVGYHYLWLVDGDLSLKTLNWQAFWQLYT